MMMTLLLLWPLHLSRYNAAAAADDDAAAIVAAAVGADVQRAASMVVAC